MSCTAIWRDAREHYRRIPPTNWQRRHARRRKKCSAERQGEMISVDEAVARITRACPPLPAESVPIAEAAGRVLAKEAIARMDQPPAPMSAMDGYAVLHSEAKVGAELSVVGEAPAGGPLLGAGRGWGGGAV